MIYDSLITMTLSVLEGSFHILSLIICNFFVFYAFGIAFRVAMTGEGRNFKFVTDVDCNTS